MRKEGTGGRGERRGSWRMLKKEEAGGREERRRLQNVEERAAGGRNKMRLEKVEEKGDWRQRRKGRVGWRWRRKVRGLVKVKEKRGWR